MTRVWYLDIGAVIRDSGFEIPDPKFVTGRFCRRDILSEDPKHIEACRGVVKFLDATIRNMAVYPPEHPSVEGVCKRAHDLMGEVLEDRKEFAVGIANGVLYMDDYFFNEPTPYSENLLKVLNAFEINNMIIMNTVTREDVLKLAGILRGTEHGRGAYLKQAEEAGLKHIGLEGTSMPADDDPLPGIESLPGIVEAYYGAVREVSGYLKDVVEGRLPSMEKAVKLVENFRHNLASNRDILLQLTVLKGYDRYTEQHCVNVCLLAMILAQWEGLGEKEVGWAALAGLLHDAGMVKVPRQIASKPGELTPGERETFKSHPVHSAGIVHGMGGPEEVVLCVERHHVFYGGGGYPPGLDGQGIPLLAGLLSVADSYDAMTTVRPYRKPIDNVQAIAFLKKGLGTRFDPQHVDALLSMLGPYPPGTPVRLSSNEIGMVVRTGANPRNPAVRMFIDEAGEHFGKPWDLELDRDEAQGRVIAGVVEPALYNLRPEAIFA